MPVSDAASGMQRARAVDEAAQMLAAASALPQLGVGIPRRCHRSRAAVFGEMHDDAVADAGLSSGSAAAGAFGGRCG